MSRRHHDQCCEFECRLAVEVRHTKASGRKRLAARSAKEAREILGLSSRASLSDVERAYRILAQQHHPDRGGDPEQMIRLTAARDSLRKIAKRRGRPRKYTQVHRNTLGKFVIVNEKDEIRYDLGFKRWREAENFLKEKQAEARLDSDDTTAKVEYLRIIGPPATMRQRAKRRRDAAKKQKYISDYNAGMSAGMFMPQADQGKGKLVTGGYDSTKLSAVYAAHMADLGGMENRENAIPARRSRPEGNGPDAYDNDESADPADLTEQYSLSDGDPERELYERDDSGRLFIEAKSGKRDQLGGPSVEDRELPPEDGLDELPINEESYRTVLNADGEPEEIADRIDTIRPLIGTVEVDTGLPKPLQDYLADERGPVPVSINSKPSLPKTSNPPELDGEVEWSPVLRRMVVKAVALTEPAVDPPPTTGERVAESESHENRRLIASQSSIKVLTP